MNITAQRIWLSDIGFWLIIVSYLLLVFGSPMPIKIGTIEIVMGVGLTIGALLLGISLIARKDRDLKLPALCLGYILLTPLLIGVARGHNLSDMVRDVAPLMFMVVLPLLIRFLPLDRNAPYRLRVLLSAICAVGLVSALQFYHGIEQLFGSMDVFVSQYGTVFAATENGVSKLIGFMLRLFGLEQADYRMLIVKCLDPAVLFSAIYLLCFGLALVLAKPRRLLPGLLALGGGGFCAYEFSALGMRAFGGLTVLALIVYVLHLIRARKVALGNLIVAGILGLLLTHTQIVTFAAKMWEKQQAGGISNRLEELYAAFGTVSENFITLLFGIGWGGVFPNPIFGGELKRFSHSLISFWLLKTGVVGFAVLGAFVILLFRRLDLKGVWTSSHRLAVFLAASAVIIIALFFEVTYKMLSFGMIVGLLLAGLALTPAPPVRRY